MKNLKSTCLNCGKTYEDIRVHSYECMESDDRKHRWKEIIIRIYLVSCGPDGKQYVAVKGVGPHERLCGAHTSSNDYWAKEHDIVPEMKKKFKTEAVFWEADRINYRIATMYYDIWREHESALYNHRTYIYNFIEWVEEVYYTSNK